MTKVWVYQWGTPEDGQGCQSITVTDKTDIAELQKMAATAFGIPTNRCSVRSVKSDLHLGLQDTSKRIGEEVLDVDTISDEVGPDKLVMDCVSTTGGGRVKSSTVQFIIIPSTHPPLAALPVKRRLSSDDTEDHLMKRLRTDLDYIRKYSPVPSQAASRAGYYENQQHDETRTVDGSGLNNGYVQVDLYHPVFAHFRAEKDEKVEVSSSYLDTVVEFMRYCANHFRKEDDRKSKVRELLATLVGYAQVQVVNSDRTSSDHASITSCTSLCAAAALTIVEEKLGLEGSADVVKQGMYSYRSFWKEPERQKLLEASCSPSFIICVAGHNLQIMGAIWAQRIMVYPLTDMLNIAPEMLEGSKVMRLACVFLALRKGVLRLRDFYTDLEIPSPAPCPHPRFFPHFRSYTTNDNKKVEFTYLRALNASGLVFEARMDDHDHGNHSIVVKFTASYGEEAHRLLHHHDKAPALHFVKCLGKSEYGNIQMVVMEYDKWPTLAAKFGEGDIPQTVKDAIREALEDLHKAGYVFGDLRRPNVLVSDDNTRVKLIDFDWALRAGVAKYPLLLNTSGIKWPKGVKRNDLILETHDQVMLERL